MKHKTKTHTLLLSSLLTLLSNVVQSAPDTTAIVIPVLDQGWWSDNGNTYGIGHDATNNNYVVGTVAGSRYRNYFSFDLQGLAGTVIGATLSLNTFFVSNDLRLNLYDVFHTPSELDTTSLSAKPEIFQDLGSGTLYGNYDVSASMDYQVVTVTLNHFAVMEINSRKGSLFSVGGDAPNASSLASQQIFAGSALDTRNVLAVTLAPIPEPTSGVLLMFGLGALFAIRKSCPFGPRIDSAA